MPSNFGVPHFNPVNFDPYIKLLNRKIRTSELIFDFLQSENYEAGVSGIRIDASGYIQALGLEVDWADVQNVSIATADIQDAAITTAKINDLAVTAAKIADATITNAKIVDATIESAKIASLDADKINAGTLTAFTIQSASSGERLVIDTDADIDFYNSSDTLVASLGYATVGTKFFISDTTYDRFTFTGSQTKLHAGASGNDIIFQSGVTQWFTGDDSRAYFAVELQALSIGSNASNPTYTFQGATKDTTGLFCDTANELGFATGGSEAGRFNSSQTLELANDLQFQAASNAFVMSSDSSNVLGVNDDGISFENAATHFPNEEWVEPSGMTAFTTGAWTAVTGSQITLWTHGGTNRTVEAYAMATGRYRETGAVSYEVRLRVQISLDNGATWSSPVSFAQGYVGTGAGGGGYRENMTSQLRVTGTATSNVLARVQYYVATAPDGLDHVTLYGQVDMVH